MASGTQLEKAPSGIVGRPPWVDRLAGAWGKSKVLWARLNPIQRSWALVAVALLVGLSAGLLWYALRPDWRILYVDLDPEDARQTAQILAQAQIPFEPSADGAGIQVPAAQLDKARLVTASKGGMKSGRLGFEIFDKPNWVGSEFDEQVNYQRALEGELERTVGTLADIESARVHLVLNHDSLFRDQERAAKASVVIKMRHRSLADGEPEAIRNLVASAVDGLTAENVVLVDASGHVPLGPKTAESLQLAAEQELEEKLVSTLEPVTGSGNVRASVTLDYDRAATDVTQEIYDPDKTVTLSMQRSEQTSGPQAIAAGVPGTASNAPNSQTLPVYPQQTTPPQSSKTESGTYAASKTERHEVDTPGRVRRLTAAIVINDRLVHPASKGKPAVWQPRSAEELRNLTALAQASVGFDASRGDLLTVQDLAFEQNSSEQPPPVLERWIDTAETSPVLVKYAALLAGLLVVLAFGVRPALRKMDPARPREKTSKEPAKELGAGAQTTAPAILKPPEPVETDPERLRAQEIFDQVADHLKREPTQSSRLLQSWIHSD